MIINFIRFCESTLFNGDFFSGINFPFILTFCPIFVFFSKKKSILKISNVFFSKNFAIEPKKYVAWLTLNLIKGLKVQHFKNSCSCYCPIFVFFSKKKSILKISNVFFSKNFAIEPKKYVAWLTLNLIKGLKVQHFKNSCSCYCLKETMTIKY